MRTKASGVAGIVLVAGIVVWRLPTIAPQAPVELTFVRYEYDAIVLNLANRTSSPMLLFGPNASNVSFSSYKHRVEAHSELQLCTTRAKLTPSSLPSKIDLQCMPLPSWRRLRVTRLLKKIGINIAATNIMVSVNLPPLDPIPMRP